MVAMSRLFACSAVLCTIVSAHGGHDGQSKIPAGQTVSNEPLVSLSWMWLLMETPSELTHMQRQGTTMWIHIFIQMVAYGVVFPIGMVLGVSQMATCQCILE